VAVVMAGRLLLGLFLHTAVGRRFLRKFEGNDDGVYVREPGYRSRLRWIIPLLLVVALAFPFLSRKYLLTVAILGLIYGLLATQYRVAVVMPETGRGFYTNMAQGLNYWDYLTTELPARMRYMFPLSTMPTDNYLMGNSMGGYGALRYALTYPQQFAAVAALSPVTDLARFGTEQAKIMPDFDLAFGSQELQNTPNDLDYLMQQSLDWSGLRVLMATGSHDILRGMDEELRPKLKRVFNDRFEWQLQSGHHDWQLWNQQLPFAMHWLIKEEWRNV